jgi:hypothetical protein
MKALKRCFWALLCLSFVSLAWAQTQEKTPRLGRHLSPRHQIANLLSKADRRAQPGSYLAPALAFDQSKTWDLGVYPGGSTAELQSINDFGVAMGWGDVPIEGGTEPRMIGIPLFGFNAGQWFESGVSSEDWTGEGGGISNTGIIAGNIMESNGWPEAYAWTPNHSGFRLGRYSDDDGSVAIAINHSGTFIVGNSGKLLDDGTTMRVTPIVWTSKVIWKDSRPTLSWEMHALPTGGWEKPGAVFDGITLNFWGGWGVNDLGQIAGDGWTSDEDGNYWEIAVVWTPTKGGKEWKVQRLPAAADVPYTEALGMNDLGDIVGDVWGWTDNFQGARPALWQVDPRNPKTRYLKVFPTTSGLSYGWSVAWGINELGDIVGSSTDEIWIGKAARWNSHDRRFVTSLGFPGDTSTAFGVNNLGIAVGGYQNTVDYDEAGSPIFGPSQAAAVRFR